MKKRILLSSLGAIALFGMSYWLIQSTSSLVLDAKQKPSIIHSADHIAGATNIDSLPRINTPATAPIDPAHAKQRVAEKKLAALLDKRLTPAMKREINSLLNPDNQDYPEQYNESGGYVDLSQRAFSVPIAVIDDNGNTIVTDITQPLPLN